MGASMAEAIAVAPAEGPIASRAAAIEIRPVRTRRERRAFVDLPRRIHDPDSPWVAPLAFERHRHFFGANPYFEHAEAAFFLAFRAGRPVGRLSAQIDSLAQREGTPRLGHFGLLEAMDEAALRALTEAAEAWLAGCGAARVQGPYSLSVNDECGLLVDGFAHRPRLMMNYAPPWYGPALEAAGYVKAKDLLAYDLHLPRGDGLAPRAKRMARRAAALEGLVERPLDHRDLRAELGRVMTVFNEAWADNWGFVPMTEAEIDAMARQMKPLLRPGLARLAEMEGEPVAMIVALPDVNQALAGLDGKLLPTGWARLLWRLRRRTDTVRVLLMGVRPAWRASARGGAIAALLVDRIDDAS